MNIMIQNELLQSNYHQIKTFKTSLARKLSKFFKIFMKFIFIIWSKRCANFSKFEQILKAIWSKTYCDKNEKITI